MPLISRLTLAPKMVLAFVAAGAIPMLVVAFISLRVSGELETQASRAQEATAATVMDTIDRNLFERYGDVQAYAQSDPARAMDPGRLQVWMDRMMGTYTPIYNLMVVADREGRIVAANRVDRDGEPLDTSGLIGSDASAEPWFADTVEDFEPAVTTVGDLAADPLTGAVFGEASPERRAMSFSYPILDDAGEIAGVWSNRFNADVIEQIFIDELAGARGEQFTLVGRDGSVLAAQGDGASAIGADASAQAGVIAARDAASGVGPARELGTGHAVLQGFARSRGFSTYPGVGWTLTADMDRDLALSAAASARRSIMLAGGALILLTGLAAWLLARSFARPIRALQREMDDIASNKNLIQRIEVTRGDEIGDMGRSFNRMMSQFHDIIREVGENARRLSGEASRSGQAAGDAGRAATEIATTIETVAEGATSQATQVRTASLAVEEITRGALEVAGRGEAAARAAVQADEAAAGGSRTLQEAAEAMSEIERAVVSAGEVVASLGGKGQEIGLIVDAIRDIAEQTNLLALNAAIEAARAGDHGRGFAVVADEVGALAEGAGEAATRIAALIRDVQDESRRAVAAMDGGVEAVASGARRMGAADEAFGAIRDRAERVRDDIAQVAASAQQLQAGTSAAETVLREMVRLAESNAAAAEQVAASAVATGASSEVSGEASAQVSRSSRELAGMVGAFTVWNPGEPDRRSRFRDLEERDPLL